MINLQKGQKISLSKEEPNLKIVRVGLGWDVNRYDGAQYDLDGSSFLTADNGKCTCDRDFVYYNNLKHPSVCIEHTGDNLTGEGNGDDETMLVYLDKVPNNIHKISFAVTIHKAQERHQSFGDVENAYIRIVNEETGSEIARYDLSEDFSVETAIIVAEIYKHNNEWKFAAVGKGWQGGLMALCRNFGLDAE